MSTVTRSRPSTTAPAARPSRAFTLIELLVVIAIIAILAAILFPVFVQARDKGRMAACMTHARQIGLGSVMYSQDYDETLVPGCTGSFNNARNVSYVHFDTLLHPYIKNWDVWSCPSAENDATRKLSVGMNKYGAALLYFDNINPPQQAIAVADLATPAEFILMNEVPPAPSNAGIASYNGQLSFGQSYGACLAYLTSVGITGAYSPNVQHYLRHQQGAVYIFADGHAKWMRPQQTFSPNILWFKSRRAFGFPLPTQLPGVGQCSSLNLTFDN